MNYIQDSVMKSAMVFAVTVILNISEKEAIELCKSTEDPDMATVYELVKEMINTLNDRFST